MYTTEFIGRRLYRLRQAVKIPLYIIAEMTGVSDHGWGAWEIGKAVPPLKSLISICNHTGVDLESFIIDESFLDDLEPDSPGVDMILDRLKK